MREPVITLLTTSELARRVGLTPDRIRQLARAGRLHPEIITHSGQRLYSEQELARYCIETGRELEAAR